MPRRLSPLAIVLAFLLFPGSAEALENAVHLVTEGHGAHAIADEEHDPEGDEHGCSPTFHTCGCHAVTSPMTPPAEAALSVRTPAASDTPSPSWGDRCYHGRDDAGLLLRPPIA